MGLLLSIKKRRMRTLLKRAIGATSVCALAVGMVLGANAFTKNENNKVSEEKKAETMLTFEYKAPLGSLTPYSDANVKNPSNWKEASEQCPSPATEEIPCSIRVPESHTLGTPGTNATIDPAQVSIQTTNVAINQFKVAAPTGSSGYSDPVNRELN
ncbi:hypothetical protein [Sphingobacterium anhuiense]|uniref:Uncharacterized protein n=1 Tax=Sphingobacterium anhuiense TaxID=493780 RepID=A0ABW5YZF1_9SPHI